jgi:DNA sulfur modification protein DndB
MPARELVGTVRPAKETEGWANASLDERIQREPNLNRVLNEIVPYLAQHPDRFFGSILVLLPAGSLEYEAVERFADPPAGYREATSKLGYLTIGAGERIALDGQHRLLAFREVISNGGTLGEFQHQVGDDDVCVIFIEYETDEKTRRIFNKINRHAKTTTAADNIITSMDDGYAIIARRLMDESVDGPLSALIDGSQTRELVEWRRSSLNSTSNKLTTLPTVYQTVMEILMVHGYRDFGEKQNPVAPPELQINAAYEIAKEWWIDVLNMHQFINFVNDLDSVNVIRNSPTDESSLLLRPLGQQVLFKGLAMAYRRTNGEVPVSELVARASSVNWSPSSANYWRDVIVRPDGRMINKREAILLAARLLEYLIVPTALPEESRDHLWADWNSMRGKDIVGDIEVLNTDEIPQELPVPPKS